MLFVLPAGEIVVGQLDQAQSTQVSTLNQTLSCEGVKDGGCVGCGWSHTCSSMVFGVVPQSLREGGHRLDIAWTWKWCPGGTGGKAGS